MRPTWADWGPPLPPQPPTPCYTVRLVLSQMSVRAENVHLAPEKPPTLVQGAAPVKVSEGFFFFSTLSLGSFRGQLPWLR